MNILIELILTNKCNKRCNYCDLEFKNKSLNYSGLDLFISFLKNNKASYTINFFWWEPLLEFKKIQYFVEKSREYVFQYSLWTNGKLLTREILDFFKDNNIKIYLSIDNICSWNDLNLELIAKYKDIVSINFINDPEYLKYSLDTFNRIKLYGFKDISFMPVFSTKTRDKASLISLKKILDYIKHDSDKISITYFSYYNWVSSDKQFILDTNLNFYSDLDSLLWIQKQYKNVEDYLRTKIDLETNVWNVKNITLNDMLNWYNVKEILKLVFEVPKNLWTIKQNILLDKVLKNGAEKK